MGKERNKRENGNEMEGERAREREEGVNEVEKSLT